MNDNRRPTRSSGRPAAAFVAWASLLLLPTTAVAQAPTGSRTANIPQPPLRLPSYHAAPASPGGGARLRPIEGGQMIALIGTQVVLASELMSPINQRLAMQYHGQLSPDVIEQIREEAAEGMQVRLAGLLEFKLVVNDAHERLPPEAIENIDKKLGESFEDEMVPGLIEQFSVTSRSALEARLREYGGSLAQLRKEFVEGQLARMWVQEQAGGIPPITRDDLYREYEAHLEDYAYPTKARWQELMVRFDRFGGDRRAAYLALVEMGNLVKGHGAPFEDVAKTRSHGLAATNGGIHDWTAEGSLVAERIDAALFGLPVGHPSEIIESADGFHIVRVLERKPAGRVPFEEAQADLREKLLAERRSEKQREYIEKLRKEVRIWTIYTGPTTAEEYVKLSASTSAPDDER